MSDESVEKFQEIGRMHQLNIEKIGILADTIRLTILGLISTKDFGTVLAGSLEIDQAKLPGLLETVEKNIFVKIREILRNSNLPKIEEVDSNNPTKDSILAEIENPTPVQHPISAASQTPTATAHEFIAAKMNGPASLPTQKYTTDPYRESLS